MNKCYNMLKEYNLKDGINMFGKKVINDFKITMLNNKEYIVNLPTSGSNNAYDFLNSNSNKGLCYLGGYIKDGTDITININNIVSIEAI